MCMNITELNYFIWWNEKEVNAFSSCSNSKSLVKAPRMDAIYSLQFYYNITFHIKSIQKEKDCLRDLASDFRFGEVTVRHSIFYLCYSLVKCDSQITHTHTHKLSLLQLWGIHFVGFIGQ